MSAKLLFFPRFKALDQTAGFLAGGKLFCYSAGTNNFKTTYSNQGGTVANQNPVILDGSGEADVWLTSGPYKFLLTDANDVLQWTVDNVEAQESDITNNSVTTGRINISGQIISTATGLAPLVVASQTVVTNLNADLLDGKDFGSPAAIGSAVPNAGTFTTLAGNSISTGAGNLQAGSKITTYNGRTLAGEGIPVLFAAVDLVGQTLAITNSVMLAFPPVGMYMVVYDFLVTAVGNAVNLAGLINWGNGFVGKTFTTANIACNTLGAGTSSPPGIICFDSRAGNINFSTTLSGAIGAGTYSVRIRVFYLG